MRIVPQSRKGTPVMERLMARVSPEPNTGCWLWLGRTNSGGYGDLKIERHAVNAHRAMWVQTHGRPVPSGMDVCHRCDVRLCVNPSHLFVGTRQENMLDCSRKSRNVAQRDPMRIGGKRPRCKLDHQLVLAMRAAGGRIVHIANAMGVSARTIERVLAREKGGRHV